MQEKGRRLSAIAVDLGTQDRQASPDRSPVTRSLVTLGRSIIPGIHTAFPIQKWHALVYIRRFPAQPCLLQINPLLRECLTRHNDLGPSQIGFLLFIVTV